MLLESILVHPDSHQPLEVDWKNQVISIGDDGTYKAGFEQGIPFILPLQYTKARTSKIHKDHNTNFNYQDHYQRDAEVFDYFQEFTSKVDQDERNRLNQMITQAIPKDATSILDVGCGNGWLSKTMVSDRTTVISMDISSRNPLEALKQNPHPRHEALIADAYYLPLKKDSIDCIVASEIMEHVPDPALFIERLLLVLKPGGKLIITTPYDEQIQYHLCVHCNRATPSHAHLHSFNETNIGELIPKTAQSWQWRTFAHKYMIKSRSYLLLRDIPFSTWKSLDQLANSIWRQPMRLMIEVVKK